MDQGGATSATFSIKYADGETFAVVANRAGGHVRVGSFKHRAGDPAGQLSFSVRNSPLPRSARKLARDCYRVVLPALRDAQMRIDAETSSPGLQGLTM